MSGQLLGWRRPLIVVSALCLALSALATSLTASSASGASGPRLWRVSTIHYYETMPAAWDWSLRTAVSSWNAAGSGIRFAATSHPRQAQLVISYGPTQGRPSSSSLGSTRHAFVHLDPSFAHQDSQAATTRVRVMELFAHELGHVLGFTAPARRCDLMAVPDPVGCGVVAASMPGYYRCRVIDAGLEQLLVRRYGGQARFPAATWCPIDPLPSAISGVAVSGGSTSAAVVTWARPSSLPTGSRARVSVWDAATCAAPPASASRSYVAPLSLRWVDANAAADDGPSCVQVALVNRYGAASSAATRPLPRYVPPPSAPTVGDLVYDQSSGTFSAPVSSGPDTTVLYRLTDDATDCSGWQETGLLAVTGATVSLPMSAPTACVAFFAHDNHGHHSEAVVRHLAAPVPGDTPTVGSVTLPAGAWPTWSVAAAAPDAGRTLALAVLHGACPSTAAADTAWTPMHTASGYADGSYPVASPGPGQNCALVTAMDRFGRPGPVVARPFTDAGPEAPAPTATTYDATQGTFSVALAKPAGYDLVAAYDEAHPTVCPTAWTSGDPQLPMTYADGAATFTTTAEQTCVRLFYRGAAQQAPWTDADRLSAPVDVTLAVPAPSAPTMGTATYDAPHADFTASASHDVGTTLRYAGTPDTQDCTAAATTPINREQAGIATYVVPAPSSCLAFYAVDQWGRVSAPTVQTVVVPLPTETPSVTAPTLYRGTWPYFFFLADLTQPQDKVGIYFQRGGCPQTAPAGVVFHALTAMSPGPRDEYFAVSGGRGVNCLMVSALDYLSNHDMSANNYADHHGPIVMREFTDAGPLPPEQLSTSYDASTNQFSFSTYDLSGYQILATYDASDPTTCPTGWSSTDAQVPLSDYPRGTETFAAPTSDTCVSFFYRAPDPGNSNWTGTADDRLSIPTEVRFTVPSS